MIDPNKAHVYGDRWAKLKAFIDLKSRKRLYCVQDIESGLIKHGFEMAKVRQVLTRLELKRDDQVEKQTIENVIEKIFQLELAMTKIANVPNEYVTEWEWRKLVARCERLERFASLFHNHINELASF